MTAVLAVACILAVGTAATGLDSAMETSADDADLLPEPLKDLLIDDPPDPESEGDQEGEDGDPEPDDAGDMDWEEATGQAQENLEATMENLNEMTEGGGGDGVSQAVNSLLDYLPYLLAALLLGALAYVIAKRYDFRGNKAEEEQAVANTYFEVDTSNDVYMAWSEMVSQLHVEDPHAKTPQEFAEAAVEEGMNPEAVGVITTLFEQVLYSDTEVTVEQEKRALDAMEKLDKDPSRTQVGGTGEPEAGEPIASAEAPPKKEAV